MATGTSSKRWYRARTTLPRRRTRLASLPPSHGQCIILHERAAQTGVVLVFTIVTSARRKAFTRARYVLEHGDHRTEGVEMKGKAVRIVLVVALLGALAVIPASTQGLLGDPQSSSGEAGVNLPMVLLVNRLELSRQQMEALRSTIDGLLGQVATLDQKRGVFEQEMIAFSGTAEELDVRLAAFRAEMKTARTARDVEMAAAVDTLKNTLTMKQGEILMAAFPRIGGRLDAVSTDPTSVGPRAQGGAMQVVGAVRGGRMMMRGGQAMGTSPSPQTVSAPTQGSASVGGKVQTMVERARERVAGRVATSASPAGDERRVVEWLERFVHVLELKLAAQP
jgi:hypothetical protein